MTNNKNEMCQCGHIREEHGNNLASIVGIFGHGDCNILECECIKFTWVSESEPDIVIDKPVSLRNGVYEY